MTETRRLKVNQLDKGDILFPTDGEVLYVGRGIKTPAGKYEVHVRYPNGRTRLCIWGAYTEVSIYV